MKHLPAICAIIGTCIAIVWTGVSDDGPGPDADALEEAAWQTPPALPFLVRDRLDIAAAPQPGQRSLLTLACTVEGDIHLVARTLMAKREWLNRGDRSQGHMFLDGVDRQMSFQTMTLVEKAQFDTLATPPLTLKDTNELVALFEPHIPLKISFHTMERVLYPMIGLTEYAAMAAFVENCRALKSR